MGRKLVTFPMQCGAFVISLLLLPPVVLYCLWRIYIAGWTPFFKKILRPHRPAVLDDPKHGEHGFIRKKDGMRLHYVARGPRDGPLLLLLHGFPQSWYSWRHQLQELSYMYRVVALDLRGFGESDKPQEIEHYAMTEITHDISETITYLGYQKCMLVGHGLGGIIAMATATMYGHQVERLVILSSPHLAVHLDQMTASLEHLTKSLYLIFVNIRYLSEMFLQLEDFHWFRTALVGFLMGAKHGTFTSDDLEAVKYYMGHEGSLCASLNYYRTMCRQKYMQHIPTSNIYSPTLILWGTANFIYEPCLAPLTKSRFIKNGRIEYVQGASHWVQEEEPRAVSELIADFLETENSQFYHDDLLAAHSEEEEGCTDTLDDIEDSVLDDMLEDVLCDILGPQKDDDDTLSWADSGHHSKSTANLPDNDYDDVENIYELVKSIDDAKQFLLAQAPLVEEQSKKVQRGFFVDMHHNPVYARRNSLPSLELDIDYPVENLHRVHYHN